MMQKLSFFSVPGWILSVCQKVEFLLCQKDE